MEPEEYSLWDLVARLIPRNLKEKLNGNKEHLVFIIHSPKVFSAHLFQKSELFLNSPLLKTKTISMNFPVRIWVDTAWRPFCFDHAFGMEKVLLGLERIHYRSIHYIFHLRLLLKSCRCARFPFIIDKSEEDEACCHKYFPGCWLTTPLLNALGIGLCDRKAGSLSKYGFMMCLNLLNQGQQRGYSPILLHPLQLYEESGGRWRVLFRLDSFSSCTAPTGSGSAWPGRAKAPGVF